MGWLEVSATEGMGTRVGMKENSVPEGAEGAPSGQPAHLCADAFLEAYLLCSSIPEQGIVRDEVARATPWANSAQHSERYPSSRNEKGVEQTSPAKVEGNQPTTANAPWSGAGAHSEDQGGQCGTSGEMLGSTSQPDEVTHEARTKDVRELSNEAVPAPLTPQQLLVAATGQNKGGTTYGPEDRSRVVDSIEFRRAWRLEEGQEGPVVYGPKRDQCHAWERCEVVLDAMMNGTPAGRWQKQRRSGWLQFCADAKGRELEELEERKQRKKTAHRGAQQAAHGALPGHQFGSGQVAGGMPRLSEGRASAKDSPGRNLGRR